MTFSIGLLAVTSLAKLDEALVMLKGSSKMVGLRIPNIEHYRETHVLNTEILTNAIKPRSSADIKQAAGSFVDSDLPHGHDGSVDSQEAHPNFE